jgi:signal transduction histidine kinase
VRALSNTVHAVNNSLQVIGGHAELMQVKYASDPALLKRAQAIHEQSDRAAAALDALMTYVRPAGAAAAIDAASIVDVALALRAHSLAQARIGVTLEGLDRRPYPVHVRGQQLLQLLLNVLLDAEEQLAGQQGARIAIGLSRTTQGVELIMQASPVPATGEREGQDGHLRVLRRLASSLGATMEIGPGPGVRVALGLPAAAAD